MSASTRSASRLDLGLEPEAGRILAAGVQHIRFSARDTLFAPGKACEGFIIIELGQVKVMVTAENGRQMVLYRLGRGESCIVTFACLMAQVAYDAEAQAESAGQALVISQNSFEQLLAISPRFRRFVFEGFGQRLSATLSAMQGIMVRHVDRRLARYLAGRAPSFRGTQAEIAAELGTAREVVSRALKGFEDKGWVKTGRGSIAIRVPQALEDFATGM